MIPRAFLEDEKPSAFQTIPCPPFKKKKDSLWCGGQNDPNFTTEEPFLLAQNCPSEVYFEMKRPRLEG